MSATIPAIKRGDPVVVETAFGAKEERIAVTGPTMGVDFRVIYVTPQEEWDSALRENRDPHGTPWPVEYVHPVSDDSDDDT